MATSGMAVAHETVKSVMAEFIGSFLFQFLGGACISNATEHGLGSGAIGNGFAFAIVLYAVTNVSGGHVNPAITAAFRATHRISNTNALAFICAQLIGSIIGAGFLRLCLPASSPAFITIGSMTDSEPGMTLIWEFLSTFFVVFVVYAVTFNKDFKPIGPFAIGVRSSSTADSVTCPTQFAACRHRRHVRLWPFHWFFIQPLSHPRCGICVRLFSPGIAFAVWASSASLARVMQCSGLDLPPCHSGWWRRCWPHFRARFPQGAQLT